MKNYFAEEILLFFKILQEEEAILTLKVLFSPFNLDIDHTAADSTGVVWKPVPTKQLQLLLKLNWILCVNYEPC